MVAGHDRIDQEQARDYVKSHGRTAKDVMTREVISVADTAELAEVAMLLETKRIKRVPVLRDGNLVGIVSRANLVRALAVTKSDAVVDAAADDHTIRVKLLAELMGLDWFKTQDWFKIWAGIEWYISGSPPTRRKRRDERCASPPRTPPACDASRSTSYHRFRRPQSYRPRPVSFRGSPGTR